MAELLFEELPHGGERRLSIRVRSKTGASVCRSTAAITIRTKPA